MPFTADFRIQLQQQLSARLGSRFPEMFLVDEEVDAEVRLLDHGGVIYGERGDAWTFLSVLTLAEVARQADKPGSTRFLSVSIPTVPEPEFTSKMFADSRAAWPLAAQRRSCRSYFLSFSEGPWRMGGVWLMATSAVSFIFRLPKQLAGCIYCR